MRKNIRVAAVLFLVFLVKAGFSQNLLVDPSIEEAGPKNRFGIPYLRWGGWIFEGTPKFEIGRVARTGASSAEIWGSYDGKIRLFSPPTELEPGRYRFSFYVRGVDVIGHPWKRAMDVTFTDEIYPQVNDKDGNLLKGTFDWLKVEYVREVKKKGTYYGRIGFWGSGMWWVDDAEIVRVPDDTPITDSPIVTGEKKEINLPGPIDKSKAVNCPRCGYLNNPDWGKCYMCGAPLEAEKRETGLPERKILASFEDGREPFNAGEIVEQYATEGKHSLSLTKGYTSWDGEQDWTGYDYFITDVYNSNPAPVNLYVEIRDAETTGYWTRVNLWTVVPPGPSSIVLPTDIYVGEKSRPGRKLVASRVTKLVFSLSQQEAENPVYFDNVRLEKDRLADAVNVPGLLAFDFHPEGGVPFRGFKSITPGTIYSSKRGYGLKEGTKIWRAFNVLQPDPLYQTFLCIENGGLMVDLPNGKYHVFVNVDNPSGYWGEFQIYRNRSIKANGREVVNESMDYDSFLKRYFKFANVEDRIEDSTFDRYLDKIFQEKEFEVEVTDGKLYVEFTGQNWANSVSCLIIYPAEQRELGKRYLENLEARRKFVFENYFHKIAPDGKKDTLGDIPEYEVTEEEKRKGYVIFAKNWMEDVYLNSIPRKDEVIKEIGVFASAGEFEPIVFSVYPLKDLGEARVSVSDLTLANNPRKKITSGIEIGVVSHRLTRITADGGVYTINPRYILPADSVKIEKGRAATFWLTLKMPDKVEPGIYRGKITLKFGRWKKEEIGLKVRAFSTPLAELDVPAGPFTNTYPIHLPWYKEEASAVNEELRIKSLKKMREYGFNMCSGFPTMRITEWPYQGEPKMDFSEADKQMELLKNLGFKMGCDYLTSGFGFQKYYKDEGYMKKVGYKDYVEFLKPVLNLIHSHAQQAGWIPVVYSLCDEPVGDAVKWTKENAEAWKKAAPPDLLLTGFVSLTKGQVQDPKDLHKELAKSLKIACLNLHDEESVKYIRDNGGQWAFYNNGRRWTYGYYMYKAVKQFDMKFRISWHWNIVAGDPFYPLDCREDDHAWFVVNEKLELIPLIVGERIREGVDDYRYILTLEKLLKQKPDHSYAQESKRIIDEILNLAVRRTPPKDLEFYQEHRFRLAEAIEKMSR